MGEKYRKIVTTGIVIALAIGEAVFLSGCSEKIHESRAVQEKEVNLQSEIFYWTCGMHPTVRSDKAGKCPICSMDLIPVEAKKGASSETQGKLGLFLNERSRDLARIKTTPVQWRKLEKEIYTVGKVAYDESTVAIVSAWAGGRIDRLYADYTGVQVRRGDHLVLMYSPQLVAAQDEYLVAYKSGNQSFITSSRKKLLLLGITEEQITRIEKKEKPQTHLTIYAPIGGTVIHKNAIVGMYVKEGDPIYKVADLRELWVIVDIFEYEIGWVKIGQKVEITALSFPGEIFSGLVAFIDPYLNEKTRTVKVRINVKNDNLRLKPGMYVNARLTSSLSDFGLPIDRTLYGKYLCPMHPDVVQQNMGTCSKCGMELEKHEIPDDKKIGVRTRVVYVCPMEEDKDVIKERPGECPKCGMKLIPKEIKRSDERVLGVPKRAVLDTGQRQLVYVEKEVGTYIAREIRIGPEAMAYVDGEKMVFFPILDGLSEGERVVVRGNFLIDSQTQITGAAEAIYGGALGKDNTAMPSGHQH